MGDNMELLRVSDNKIKIILSRVECDELGVFDSEDEKEVERRIWSIIEKSEESLPSGDLKIRVSPRLSGGMEIVVEKDRLYPEIHTFVIDKEGLEKALSALKNTDFLKNSTLYKTREENVYIWEVLASPASAALSRLEDFSRRIVLSSRRDFLSVCAERIPFFPEECHEENRTGEDT